MCPSRRKLAAFERAAAAAKGAVPAEEMVERTMFSLESGHAAASRLIGRGVSGIICASDPLALGAIRAARRADPRSLAICRSSGTTTRRS
jgi:DNA-binding LacI/PurR family transcriptional regulator